MPTPLNITYNNGSNEFQMNPENPHVDKNVTVQFNASDRACTICFNPANTPFGDHQDVPTGSPVQVNVGNNDYSVGYCITDSGLRCAAPTPPHTHNSPTGTIKVGS